MVGVALKGLGHHVRIFERHPATRMEGQGAGITAQTDVQQFFRDYGLSEPPYSVHSPNVQIQSVMGLSRAHGTLISRIPAGTLYIIASALLSTDNCPNTAVKLLKHK